MLDSLDTPCLVLDAARMDANCERMRTRLKGQGAQRATSTFFAVGKVAEDALGRWEEVPCAGYIRHPAQGGESRFRAGFRDQVVARL